MKYLLVALSVLFVLLSPVKTQDWANNAEFENFAEYFANLMQETLYEVERRGWCNLELDDITVNINERIYDRTFTGPVQYTNGFLVSIQKIDITNLMQHFSATSGQINAFLNLRDVKIGFDVIANLTDLGVHRFTGTYIHTNVQYQMWVLKNLNTGVLSITIQLWNLPAGNLMEYMPDTEIAEVLSRHYRASDVWNSMQVWGTQVFRNVMLETIEKIGFPEVCFNC